jgi:hypothetical protein
MSSGGPLEDDDVLDDELSPDEAGPARLGAAVGDELRDRVTGVRDHDLLALPDTPQQMREKIARVARVVLRELAWVGVAGWRELA